MQIHAVRAVVRKTPSDSNILNHVASSPVVNHLGPLAHPPQSLLIDADAAVLPQRSDFATSPASSPMRQQQLLPMPTNAHDLFSPFSSLEDMIPERAQVGRGARAGWGMHLDVHIEGYVPMPLSKSALAGPSVPDHARHSGPSSVSQGQGLRPSCTLVPVS